MAKKTEKPAKATKRGKQGDGLAEKLEKTQAQLKKARARVRELEAGPVKGAVSPFAPKRFPEMPEIAGFRLATAAAGVRYSGRLDVMLAEAARGSTIAGVFTRSSTRAAPVLWCQERLTALDAEGGGGPYAILVNAGNANAFTGADGRRGVETAAKATAKALRVKPGDVFMASTGVIGEPLPVGRITAKLRELKAGLSLDGWRDAARAIMTTDTFAKAASADIVIAGRRVRIAGIAKGSGMIAPDMATMLAFIATDADVSQTMLQKLTAAAADGTFNAVSVDGDTSTSDTVLVAATGKSSAPRIDNPRAEGRSAFRDGLEMVMAALAEQVAKDGEGLTKFVKVRVEGARSRRAARDIARSIANSPLVKTAWAGQDPNWGRIVMAVGKSGQQADRDRLSIRYGPHVVAENGARAAAYSEQAVAEYMKDAELELTVDVGVGAAAAEIWTCDLTHGYVSINADYRS